MKGGRGVSEDPFVRPAHTYVGATGGFGSGGIMMRCLLLGFFNRCHEERIATSTTKSCGFERDCKRSIPNELRLKRGSLN